MTSSMFASAVKAQRIVSTSPGINSDDVSPTTSISGLFEADGQSKIVPNSVKIFLNGNEVTSRSTITSNFFSYRPTNPLPLGTNQIRIEYETSQGEQRTARWNFQVANPQAGVEITAINHNAEDQPLGPNATFLATINGTPGADASIYLVRENQMVKEFPAQEVSSGVYVATLNLESGDINDQSLVVGRLEKSNQTAYEIADQAIQYSRTASTDAVPQEDNDSNETATNFPLRPVFINYQSGDTIDSRGFTLTGQTQPSAKVEVVVNSSLPVLGGIVNVGDNQLMQRTVTADKNGRFEVEVPAPNVVTSGMRYKVRATATDDGETSSPVEITLTQQ